MITNTYITRTIGELVIGNPNSYERVPQVLDHVSIVSGLTHKLSKRFVIKKKKNIKKTPDEQLSMI